MFRRDYVIRFDSQRSTWLLLSRDDSAAPAIANYATRDAAMAGIDSIGRWLEDAGWIATFAAEDEAGNVIDERRFGDSVCVA